MASPEQPWQHTKSPRISSLSFHRYDIITSMLILIWGMASNGDITYYMTVFYFSIIRLKATKCMETSMWTQRNEWAWNHNVITSLWRHSIITSSWNYLISGIIAFFWNFEETKILTKEIIIQSRIGAPHKLWTCVHNIHAVQCTVVRIRLCLHERLWRGFFLPWVSVSDEVALIKMTSRSLFSSVIWKSSVSFVWGNESEPRLSLLSCASKWLSLGNKRFISEIH